MVREISQITSEINGEQTANLLHNTSQVTMTTYSQCHCRNAHVQAQGRPS